VRRARPHRGPGPAPLAPAGLPCLWRIDTFEPDAGPVADEGIAIDDADGRRRSGRAGAGGCMAQGGGKRQAGDGSKPSTAKLYTSLNTQP
jgi:hypothetical protein